VSRVVRWRFARAAGALLASRPLDLGNLVLKFVKDKILAAVLVVIIAPLMVVIATAIHRAIVGPVFCRQRRYGPNYFEFKIWKFRIMLLRLSRRKRSNTVAVLIAI